MKQTLTASTILSIIAIAGLVLSANTCQAGEWGLGLGVAAQDQPQRGADTQVVVLPFPSYEGERLSLGFGNVAYALTKDEKFRVSVAGQLRFDGYNPDDNAALSGLRERDFTLDVGFNISSEHDWGVVSVQVMNDAFSVHEGYEVTTSFAYPISANRWTLVPTVSAHWLSANLVEYYYGVRLDEATAERPAYTGKGAFNVSATLNAAYRLSDKWEIIGGGQYTHLGDEITESPIIGQDREVILYSGIVYRF